MLDFLTSFFHGFKVPAKLYWDPPFQQILETHSQLVSLRIDYWLTFVLGKWYWWFLLCLTAFPLLIWWKYGDRQRFLEVSFFGMMVSLSAGILDTCGVFLGTWTYPYELLPFLSNFFPLDYVVIPVIFLLLYQKYSGWKAFVIASTLVSAVLSLVLDPVMVWLNFYQPLSWQYHYSIPIFVIMVCFCKLVTMIISGRESQYGGFIRRK